MATARDELDQAVARLMRRCRKAVTATDVATRLDVSYMAAMYSLKRLRDRGDILSSVVLMDSPTRLRVNVTVYQRPGMQVGLWPAWLCPRALPQASGRRMVMGAW